MEITNVCNINSSFCHGHKRAPRSMRMDEFFLIPDKIYKKTEYVYYHLILKK